MAVKKGKKHPLLVYRVRYRRHRGLYFFVAFVVLALFVVSRLLPAETWYTPPWSEVWWVHDYDWVLLIIGLVVLGLAVFRIVAGTIPYVQCSTRNLKIQAPLYQAVFSYKRVHETRPNTLFHVFEKGGLSRGERKFVTDDRYGGQTAVIVEMYNWPMSMRWMRFWLGNLVFSSDNRALVLWVDDWMDLNREISDYKDRWRERQKQAREGGQTANLYREVLKKK
jgi:hypothetical protein